MSEPLGTLGIIQYSFYFVEGLRVTEQVQRKNLVVSPSPKIPKAQQIVVLCIAPLDEDNRSEHIRY